ncbi:Tripartite-type tricarboxylate transporter, receptor component TctC [Variovorax sp. YR752]|uniref:tripartite tricarboxylate transporter substrate binding protein n=1 Tax=Variovorax sp. YR752 TaxID=1884383 RepID=UPI000BDB084E|nr:tripartite tricarboxylate transporter substrate binding protein [Variovorax sp. YR752]SOD26287.1 Tripartite-type tricarboxylate transporter, receptor component TctC [Variovorax sp. YR752]
MKLFFAPWLHAGLLALAALSSPLAAQAQNGSDYPTKPIRLIVPYPPGGGTDVIARIVQERFQTLLGQPVLIDNRGGAAGSIGTEVVAKSAPDGYTVLFTLSSHTINPAIYAKLSFDTAKDFAPVGMVASLPQILVANTQFAPNTVAELIALAKAKPDSIAFASVGNGSPGHLAGELLKLRTGTHMTHIPYRGGGPAVTDVMGGQVPLLWVSIPAAAQFVKAGKLKALAVSTTKRSAAFPDVPTMQEAGVPDFDVDSWYAVFVPAKTPQPAIDKLNRVINTVVKEPDIRDKLLAQGSEGVGGTPEQLGKVVTTELVRWQKLAKEASIKVD